MRSCVSRTASPSKAVNVKEPGGTEGVSPGPPLVSIRYTRRTCDAHGKGQPPALRHMTAKPLIANRPHSLAPTTCDHQQTYRHLIDGRDIHTSNTSHSDHLDSQYQEISEVWRHIDHVIGFLILRLVAVGHPQDCRSSSGSNGCCY